MARLRLTEAQRTVLKLCAKVNEDRDDGYGEVFARSDWSALEGDLHFRNFDRVVDALERKGLTKGGAVTDAGRAVLAESRP